MPPAPTPSVPLLTSRVARPRGLVPGARPGGSVSATRLSWSPDGCRCSSAAKASLGPLGMSASELVGRTRTGRARGRRAGRRPVVPRAPTATRATGTVEARGGTILVALQGDYSISGSVARWAEQRESHPGDRRFEPGCSSENPGIIRQRWRRFCAAQHLGSMELVCGNQPGAAESTLSAATTTEPHAPRARHLGRLRRSSGYGHGNRAAGGVDRRDAVSPGPAASVCKASAC